MDPAIRLEDGTPLWLTGEIRTPKPNEFYWHPTGALQATGWRIKAKRPILSKTPLLPDPHLAGRIDEALMYGWNESQCYPAARGKELLRQARKHIWGSKP